MSSVFRICWGYDTSTPPAGCDRWGARTIDSGSDQYIYGSASLNESSSLRVFSARHEDEQLVFKVSDQEYSTAITSGGIAYDMECMIVGEFFNGEIKEIVLTSDVPTATQISQLESYFKAQYPDVVETL